ncbi:MAG: archease [Desulfurococcales archaeon]|nr:archease [Desulfurococcales archaeon]
MEGCGGFKFLEHTADAYVEASGRSLEEAFINAAKALFELITDTSKVCKSVVREVRDEGLDLQNALYRWLEDLLILHDSEGLVFSDFDMRIKELQDKIAIEGRAWGEKFDPSKHEVRTEVKAVTYSLMEIKEIDGCWIARVVFDL